MNQPLEQLKECPFCGKKPDLDDDTLSGRTDGPDDRAWQRESVIEMTRRAIAALAAIRGT